MNNKKRIKQKSTKESLTSQLRPPVEEEEDGTTPFVAHPKELATATATTAKDRKEI